MTVVTIGNFDGVHLGHRHLINQVVQRARRLDTDACAVTFDPHPRALLRPDAAPLNLTAVQDRVGLMRRAGLDDVWVCPFTPEIARLAPTEFLAMVSARWRIDELWVGHDFALGRGRSGSLDVLRDIGERHGWSLHVVQPLRVDGEVVSSSRIRHLLAAGRRAEAAELLAA
jgi:riboflavin kinase / FMN adenylyltransferase